MIAQNMHSSVSDRPLSRRCRSTSFVSSRSNSHPIYPALPLYPISSVDTHERVKDDELPDPSSVARREPMRLHRQGRVAHPALEPPAPSSVRQAVLATIGIDPMKATNENADDDRRRMIQAGRDRRPSILDRRVHPPSFPLAQSPTGSSSGPGPITPRTRG